MRKKTIIAVALFVLFTTVTPLQKINISNFNLKEIKVENNFLIQNQEIKKILIPIYDRNLFFLSYLEIEKELKKNTLIKGFEIKKKYPNTLKIKIFEKQPIAILLNRKKKYYLSEKLDLIKFSEDQKFNNLPYVIGNQKSFRPLYNNLKEINFPIQTIRKFTLYDSSRWDLETLNDKVIKLPSKNYNESLKNFLNLVDKSAFKKYKVFDYRIKDQLILK